MANKSAVAANGQEINRDFDLLRSVIDAATEYAIIGIDLDGMIVFWNEGA